MDDKFYSLYSGIKNTMRCDDCDGKENGACKRCNVTQLLSQVTKLDKFYADGGRGSLQDEFCPFCTDKNGKSKEIMWDNGRGGFPLARYCPECGRKIQ